MLIVLLAGLAPLYAFVAVNIAGVLAAGAEFTVARRLRARYVSALEGGLKRQGEDLPQAAPRFDFTIAGGMVGLDALRYAARSTRRPGRARLYPMIPLLQQSPVCARRSLARAAGRFVPRPPTR